MVSTQVQEISTQVREISYNGTFQYFLSEKGGAGGLNKGEDQGVTPSPGQHKGVPPSDGQPLIRYANKFIP